MGRQQHESPAQPGRLVRDPYHPHAWIVRVNGTDQSFIDLDDPTHLEFDYVQHIGHHLDLHAPPGQRMGVVHIGGAGMTLARYVAATRPRSPQIVLEPDAVLTAEVRDVAPLPRNSGIKVRPVDGRSGLAAMPDDYTDVVIVDAFDGSSVPGELVTVECFKEVSRVLHADGLLVLNLADQELGWTKAVMAGLQEVFGHTSLSAEPRTFKARRYGNLIAGASGAPLPLDELIRRAARSAFPYRLLSGAELRRFLAGARPYADEAPVSSPRPEQTLTWYG